MINILRNVSEKLYLKRYSPKKELVPSLSDIFFANCKEKTFLRPDVTCAYLAVENHYGKNDCGFDLYRKMQDALGNDGSLAVENLENLIRCCDAEGCGNLAVDVTRLCTLEKGSEQFALALYHNVKYPKVTFTQQEIAPLGEDFLADAGFSQDEIRIVCEKNAELYSKANRAFTCIIWSPAFPFHQDIAKDFSAYGKVSNLRRYDCSEKQFCNIVRRIYAMDSIAKWKVDTKIKFFKKHSKSLMSFDIILDCVDFAPNNDGSGVLSRTGLTAKRTVRGNHKDKVENYIYDVILHTCDNFCQSDCMQNILSAADSQEIVLQ